MLDIGCRMLVEDPVFKRGCEFRVSRCALRVAPLLLRSKRDLRSASTGWKLTEKFLEKFHKN
jgi:hypothetical protein